MMTIKKRFNEAEIKQRIVKKHEELDNESIYLSIRDGTDLHVELKDVNSNLETKEFTVPGVFKEPKKGKYTFENEELLKACLELLTRAVDIPEHVRTKYFLYENDEKIGEFDNEKEIQLHLEEVAKEFDSFDLSCSILCNGRYNIGDIVYKVQEFRIYE